jgi:rhodanese-related sulfurtransferase
MDQLFTFVSNHPVLVGIFAVLLILFIRNELQRGGATISAQQLVQLVNNDNAVVVDVRDKSEFDQGHIVDAINIPYSNLDARAGELDKYKERPLVVACKMGQHSGTAGTILRKKGFENVSRLRGGITEWRGQNLPVVKGR